MTVRVILIVEWERLCFGRCDLMRSGIERLLRFVPELPCDNGNMIVFDVQHWLLSLVLRQPSVIVDVVLLCDKVTLVGGIPKKSGD